MSLNIDIGDLLEQELGENGLDILLELIAIEKSETLTELDARMKKIIDHIEELLATKAAAIGRAEKHYLLARIREMKVLAQGGL